MEFKLQEATPESKTYLNEYGQRVVFYPKARRHKVYASRSLMGYQVAHVVEAEAQGKSSVVVP